MRPEDWLPLWVSACAGIVLGALLVAYAFSRPMSRLKRLGSVALGLMMLVICPAIGYWLIVLRSIGDPSPPAP
jgi:ABC-type molybdate transport system permease subunit